MQSNASEASQLLIKQLEDQKNQITLSEDKISRKKAKMRDLKSQHNALKEELTLKESHLV